MDKSSLGKGPEGAQPGEKPAVSSPEEVTRSVSVTEISREARRPPDEPSGSGPKAAAKGGSDVSDPSKPAPVRPMKMTPGGGYSALLAHARPKRSDGAFAPRTQTPSGSVTFDPMEITAVSGASPAPKGAAGPVIPPAGRARTLTPDRALVADSEFEGQEITQSDITLVGGSDGTAAGNDSGKVTVTSDKKMPIPRPTRLTPGGGGLASLLAQRRERARGDVDALADSSAPVASPVGPSAPIADAEARKPGFTSTLRPGVLPTPDASLVVPPQSNKRSAFSSTRPGPGTPLPLILDEPSAPVAEPAVKRHGLAGTLLGVQRPDLNLPGRDAADAPWMRPVGGAGSGPARGDDSDWTDRNSGIPGVGSGSLKLDDAEGDELGATPLDRLRKTAVLDVIHRAPARRWPIAVGIGAAIVLAGVAVLWPRFQGKPPAPAVQHADLGSLERHPLTAPVVDPVPSAPPAAVPPQTEPKSTASAAPAEAPPPVEQPAAASGTTAPATAPAAEEAPATARGVAAPEAPSATREEPAAPAAAEPVAAAVEEPAPPRKSVRRTSRAESRAAKVKAKRKNSESRSRKESAASGEGKSTPSRGRPASTDPDATLPLGQ